MDAPTHYKRSLLAWGGTNLYGEPRFVLHWGPDLVHRRVAPAEHISFPPPQCWCLCEWLPAEEYGSEDSWPKELPYPSAGRYEPIIRFENDGVPLQLDTRFLNLRVLNMMVYHTKKHRYDSLMKRKAALQEMREREEKAERDRIADCLHDAVPQWTDAVSYRGQTNTHSATQKKVEEIEQGYRNAWRFRQRQGAGLSVAK